MKLPQPSSILAIITFDLIADITGVNTSAVIGINFDPFCEKGSIFDHLNISEL